MKFNVSSKKLFEQLQAVSKVIAARNSLQILESVLFDIEGEQLTLTSSSDLTIMRSDVRIARNYITRTCTMEFEESKPNQEINIAMEMEEIKIKGEANTTHLGEMPQWIYDHNRICVLEKQMSEMYGKVAQIDYRVNQLEKAPKSLIVDSIVVKDMGYPTVELTQNTPKFIEEDKDLKSNHSEILQLYEYIVEDSVKTDNHYGYGYGETPNEKREIERTRIETYNRRLVNLVKDRTYAALAKECRNGEAKGHLDFKGLNKYDVGRSFQKLCPDVEFKIDSFSRACYAIGWQPKPNNVVKR